MDIHIKFDDPENFDYYYGSWMGIRNTDIVFEGLDELIDYLYANNIHSEDMLYDTVDLVECHKKTMREMFPSEMETFTDEQISLFEECFRKVYKVEDTENLYIPGDKTIDTRKLPIVYLGEGWEECCDVS